MPKLEPYDKSSAYGYCLGVFPCHELLSSRPETAARLLLHPSGLENEGVEKLRERCRALGIREETAERVLRRESKKDNCFAALLFEKRESELALDKNHLALCQISDFGNFGTIVRAAAGFGYTEIAVIRPCVDIFDPHAIRASMGAFFRLNLKTFDSFDDYVKSAGERSIELFMLDASIPLNAAARTRRDPHTLAFGNEAKGLDPETAKYGRRVIIPQSDKIDSLNLAVAASIAMYTYTNIES